MTIEMMPLEMKWELSSQCGEEGVGRQVWWTCCIMHNAFLQMFEQDIKLKKYK